MGYNNNTTAYGNNRNNRDNRGNYKGQREMQKKIEAQPLPEDFVDKAEDVFREKMDVKKITTSKIRRLFSLLVEIYNREILRTADTLADESLARIQLARIRMLYEAGRDKDVKCFLEVAKLVEYLKDIGTSRAKLLNYFHYMEALVAYHKFYGGKEG